MQNALRRKLKDNGKDHLISNYYWERKAQKKQSNDRGILKV